MMGILSIILIFLLAGCTNTTPERDAEKPTEKIVSRQNIKTSSEEKKETQLQKDPVKTSDQSFKKELKSGPLTFLVYNKNNLLKIKMKGFETINDSFTHKIDGKVTGAEIADLNKDGFPELYVFYSSEQGNKEGDIIAYGSNRNKSATPIYVRHPAKNHTALQGYLGHDEYFIENDKIIREFVVSNEDMAKKRIIYKLIRGETSLILQME